MDFKIPLRNRNKEIIDYAIVSEIDYEHLNKFKWCKGYYNYINSKINNKAWSLHRYIMIEILKNNIDSHTKIDHIDNNPLNNKRCNLRIVTNSENSRNKIKKEGCSSIYTGVTSYPNTNKWRAYININKKKYNAYYFNEHYAGHQYNLWCKEFNLVTANLNIISKDKLIDFVLYEKSNKVKKGGDHLPKGITLSKNKKYQVQLKSKLGTYKTLEDAIKVRNDAVIEYEQNKLKEIYNTPIKKDIDGNCIIEIFNKKKQKIGETIIDENIYYDLIKYKWSFRQDYICNSDLGLLHRYILKYNGKDLVDHINNNKLDNRKENLRIVTKQQNNLNKSSSKNSYSKYIGVTMDKDNKYIARITYEQKIIYLGYFENEIDAAKARDIATLKYFGEYGNLNFPN